jgi:hypothetical protein
MSKLCAIAGAAASRISDMRRGRSAFFALQHGQLSEPPDKTPLEKFGGGIECANSKPSAK